MSDGTFFAAGTLSSFRSGSGVNGRFAEDAERRDLAIRIHPSQL
jgi:hypothetical protein